MKNPVQNPNKNGQGFDPGHKDHPYHDIIRKHGYRYSHSTPINDRQNPDYMHHTYSHLDMRKHVVGVDPHGWQVGKLGTGGRRYAGVTPRELDRFLASHIRRAIPKLNDPLPVIPIKRST